MGVTRKFWVKAHRYAGLFLAAWLSIVGLTGAILAFYPELEHATEGALPALLAPPTPGAPVLAPEILIEKGFAASPRPAEIDYAPLHVHAGEPFYLFMVPKGERHFDNEFYTILNPHTGAVIAEEDLERETGFWHEVLHIIYEIHYSLLLGAFGTYLLGIAAFVWMADCFVGMYLTFPRGKKQDAEAKPRGWLSRWLSMWKIRWPTTRYKFNFDLHVAGGLWLWAMLLMFAWSSVAFNLRLEAYNPAMSIFGYEDPYEAEPEEPVTRFLPFAQLLDAGRSEAKAEMERQGIELVEEDSLFVDLEKGSAFYTFSTDADTHDITFSIISIDAATGERIGGSVGTERHAANTFTDWILALHMARWGGVPYKILVSVIGLLIVALSVTGVIIWTKKRGARLKKGELTLRDPKPVAEQPA
jgi:uncharacterized iron-regulated membrane protein